MINTYSVFYYGFEVNEGNCFLDFDEGNGELTAEIPVGSYTSESFAVAVATAMNNSGDNVYSVSFDRNTRKITISSDKEFSLLVQSGTHIGSSPWSLMGFTGEDRTGSDSYTGDESSGDFYSPQFLLQEYVSSSDFQQAVDATVHKTASGRVEVVKFGNERFMECNIMFATDIPQSSGGPIRNNPNGYTDLRRFMEYLITKGPIEFMPDENDRTLFETMILESTPESDKGISFKLKEMYDRGIPGYFQTGRLKFRVVEV